MGLRFRLGDNLMVRTANWQKKAARFPEPGGDSKAAMKDEGHYQGNIKSTQTASSKMSR